MTSIPSLNVTPRTSFGNWLWRFAIAAQLPYAVVHGELAELNARMPRTKGRIAGSNGSIGKATADHGIYTTSVLFKEYMTLRGFIWTPTMAVGSGCSAHRRIYLQSTQYRSHH